MKVLQTASYRAPGHRSAGSWCRPLAVLAMCALGPWTPAAAAVVSDQKITLNFQNADLRALIGTVSKITGRNFIVDPRVKGKVTLISGEQLDAKDLYSVFLSVLQVHNFAAIPGPGGVIKIVPAALVKQSPTPTSFARPGVAGDAQVTQIYRVKHGSVQELVPVLRPLLPPTSHFAAHAASNTLVFTGSAGNVNRLLRVIQRIDQPRMQGDIHVLRLRFAKATDLVKVLSNILSSRQKGARTKKAAATPTTVQAVESTNALVIQAPQEDFELLREVIAKLDVRRAQVFIEVLIAEISEDKSQNLGIRWEFGDNNLKTGETTGNTAFTDTTGGITLGFIKGLVTNLDGTTVPDLQVILTALRTDSNTNILSTPNLLTLDNETAEIVVGQEVPFITGQFTTSASTTSTDPTTGTAVTNPFQTIQRKDVGLKLKITPQINDDNSLRLEIEQEVSSVSPTRLQGASDLITNTRSISATVMVDDGEMIVLGGLMTDDFKDTVEMVPLLGQIPFIGALFRKKSKTAVKTNLMVFLRPKIIRSASDLAATTENKYDLIQEREKRSLPRTRWLIPSRQAPVLPEKDGTPVTTPPPWGRVPQEEEDEDGDD